MPFDPVGLEEAISPSQRMFWKYGIAEAGLDQSLNCFGVVGLHHHPWRHADLLKKAIDDLPHVASFGIKQERSTS